MAIRCSNWPVCCGSGYQHAVRRSFGCSAFGVLSFFVITQYQLIFRLETTHTVASYYERFCSQRRSSYVSTCPSITRSRQTLFVSIISSRLRFCYSCLCFGCGGFSTRLDISDFAFLVELFYPSSLSIVVCIEVRASPPRGATPF